MQRALIFLALGISFNFVYPQDNNHPRHFGDLFNSSKFLLGKEIFKGDVGSALSKISFINNEGNFTEFFRFTTKINFNINLYKDFYFKNTFYIDQTNTDEFPLWLASHFYSIGVYNWRNKTFSYGYENFQPNRFFNVQFDYWTNMKRGFFFVSYNYEISAPKALKKSIFFDTTTKFLVVPLVRLQPVYVNALNESVGILRPTIGTNLRYVMFKNIYVESGLFYYPIAGTRLPWDPDFTYGFGIFDWQAFKINFTYGNWIANRFPWFDKEMKHGFMNGEFVLSLNYVW
jgi:hypothetical protein